MPMLTPNAFLTFPKPLKLLVPIHAPRQRALLLQALFSVRSERQLMEQITYNMMFRWFVGLSVDGCAGVGRDSVHQEP